MALELLLKAHRHALALLNRVHQFTSYFYLFPPFTLENAEQSFLPQRAPLPHEEAGRAGEAHQVRGHVARLAAPDEGRVRAAFVIGGEGRRREGREIFLQY